VSIRIGKRVFAPGLAGTLATALLLPCLLALGFWQLERAEQKRALIAAYEAGADRLIEVGSVAALQRLPRYQRVRLRGHYEPARQVLLDNMPSQQGRPGYQVLTPLRLPDGDVVLVNRGWVPLGTTRESLPEIAVGAGSRDVTGRLAGLPRPGLRVGEAPAFDAPNWPLVLNYPTAEQLADLYDEPIAESLVLLDPEDGDGYERAWEARFGFGPERHVGYAVQWFALAAALLAIYVGVNLRHSPATKQET
jgi:surfeit locus 1 family protein